MAKRFAEKTAMVITATVKRATENDNIGKNGNSNKGNRKTVNGILQLCCTFDLFYVQFKTSFISHFTVAIFSSCHSSLYFIGLTRPIESHSEVWGNILAGALWEENFFLKMVHFCVLYISERRQGSKRRGTRGI